MAVTLDSRSHVSSVNRQQRKIQSRKLTREYGRTQRILPDERGPSLGDALDYAESLTDQRDLPEVRILRRF